MKELEESIVILSYTRSPGMSGSGGTTIKLYRSVNDTYFLLKDSRIKKELSETDIKKLFELLSSISVPIYPEIDEIISDMPRSILEIWQMDSEIKLSWQSVLSKEWKKTDPLINFLESKFR